MLQEFYLLIDLIVSIGHETVMASCTFFSQAGPSLDLKSEFDWLAALELNDAASQDLKSEFDALALEPIDVANDQQRRYALLEFDRPVWCPDDARYIASRLELESSKQ